MLSENKIKEVDVLRDEDNGFIQSSLDELIFKLEITEGKITKMVKCHYPMLTEHRAYDEYIIINLGDHPFRSDKDWLDTI